MPVSSALGGRRSLKGKAIAYLALGIVVVVGLYLLDSGQVQIFGG